MQGYAVSDLRGSILGLFIHVAGRAEVGPLRPFLVFRVIRVFRGQFLLTNHRGFHGYSRIQNPHAKKGPYLVSAFIRDIRGLISFHLRMRRLYRVDR